MDKDFAETLVDALLDAAHNWNQAFTREAAEKLAQCRTDLIHALTVPRNVEADDFMTVRDEFAKATLPSRIEAYNEGDNWTERDAVRSAYDWADLMMAERARRQGGDQ